jgi:hypothetical protein
VTRRALLLLALTGCIHRPVHRLFGATPETATCAHARNTHNTLLVSGALAGGLAGAGGLAVGIETDQGQRVGTAIAAGTLGVGAALLTVLAGIKADDYTQECSK